jgi:dihydroceramidase
MSLFENNASVNFCEKKFEYSPVIAEYHNSFSSLFYVLIGLMLLPTKLKTMGRWLCLVGIGAFLLHATLCQWAQMLDESAMLGLSFSALKQLKPSINNYFLIPTMIIYFIMNEYFFCFFSMFTTFQLLIVNYATIKINAQNKSCIVLYIISFIFATICWFLDQGCKFKFNKYLEPLQFHAWWHFFTSAAIGFGAMALLIPDKIDKEKLL